MKDNEGKDISAYTYHKDGAFIYNPDPELMCEGYLINDNDKLCYIERDGNIYPLFKSDYITVDGEIYVVNYEQLNLNPWVTIKGKIYRGAYTENGYIFSIASQDNIPITSQGTLYQYNNKIYLPTEKDNKIDGYIEIDGHQYLIKDNKLSTDIFGDDLQNKKPSESSKGYIVDIKEGIVKIYEPYEVYTATIVSGESESKLSSLECLGGYLYDNIGNKMPGMLLTSDEPITSDTVLVPTYKSGQTAHLSDLGDGLYWGDYLAEVKCDSTAQTYTFVYYIGCEITKDESTKNYVMKNGGFEGVKYTETVPYIVKTCQYYLDNKEYVTLKYNSLEFEQIVYPNNDYDNTVLSVNKAHFEYNTTLNITDDFMLSPVIKDEHKIGINGPENIEADIYINRGVARAYDYHLKLMETKTFDALENYGNSWFKII